jgi:hypothetical protein
MFIVGNNKPQINTHLQYPLVNSQATQQLCVFKFHETLSIKFLIDYILTKTEQNHVTC